MKSPAFLILICLVSFNFFAGAQGNNNRKPRIVGQDPLATNEDQSITILATHLTVEDPDDWFYPWGFTMQLYPGQHYTLNGHVVTPVLNFNGKLMVQVTVHDGQDESNRFNLEITVNPVNDRPVITGHTALATNEGQPVAVQLTHLKVTDPDNNYPGDFTLALRSGNNYTVEGSNIIPQTGFSGTLAVLVTVNDGQADSDPYALPIEVKPVDRAPQITAQSTVQVNEDESIAIALTHLTVVDMDSNYPQGFTLALAPGNNYTVSGSTVTPGPDFFGKLTVPVTVNDGAHTSNTFNLAISVTPVNDMPRITDLETEPIFYGSTDSSVRLSEALNVIEVDGDSIMFAEVGIRPEGYLVTTDQLVFTPPANSGIRGVFDSNIGVLTLFGQASPASYTEALRSVSFQTIAPASNMSKVLFIVVNDGTSDSETFERRLQFGRASVSLDIPTGFTPNGDLQNDTWKIVPLKTEEAFSGARVRVYNRSGILVYESVGLENEWDGRLGGELLPADTYFYTIDLNIDAPEGYLKGLVTILR